MPPTARHRRRCLCPTLRERSDEPLIKVYAAEDPSLLAAAVECLAIFEKIQPVAKVLLLHLLHSTLAIAVWCHEARNLACAPGRGRRVF